MWSRFHLSFKKKLKKTKRKKLQLPCTRHDIHLAKPKSGALVSSFSNPSLALAVEEFFEGNLGASPGGGKN